MTMKKHGQLPTPLLYEDDDWLAVNKPTGLNSHGPRPGVDGVVEWLALHQDWRLHLCSRLDKGTSGVLLLAKHGRASGRAQEIHGTDQAEKIYHFVTDRSKPGQGQGRWQVDIPLDGKVCQTVFRLLTQGQGYYCYEARIHRGRTHQIRRHAAACGLPILGDVDYGGTPFARLCLHCHQVQWPEFTKPVLSPTPDSFDLLLAGADELSWAAAVAWERRLAWPLLGADSLRLVQRGELPLAVSIDFYNGYLVVSSFADEAVGNVQARLTPILDYFAAKLPCYGGVVRRHVHNPHQRQLTHSQVSWGQFPGGQHLAQEHGLDFGINFSAQHLGLFLDQRDSRRRIMRIAKGQRVANLFAFSCSFSLMAVAAGAEVVFSVDLAGSALARGKENFALNGLDRLGKGKFIKEDVRKWLARQERKYRQDPAAFRPWNIIICDPPVFASGGKGRGWQVEKEWPELARQVRLLLARNGIALFANNHRQGRDSYYEAELANHFRKVIPLNPPLDFPVLPQQPPHVRIYWCEV